MANDTSVSLPISIGAKATRITSNQTLTTGTWTAILLNGETWDSGALHDTVTNSSRITVPVAGKYICCAGAIFAANATGSRYIALGISGTRQFQMPQDPGQANTNYARELSDVLNLVAGDYVELYCFQSSGGNLDIVSGGAYLSVVFLGI